MSESVPAGWTYQKVGNFIKLQGGYAFSSTEFVEYGIPVIRISNIKANGAIDLSDAVFHEESDQFLPFQISDGDILVAMSGATTGKIGKYKSSKSAYLNQRVGRFQNKNKDAFIIDYLHHISVAESFQKEILIDAIGGAQPNISSSQIESISIHIPPLPEQQKIASILTSVDTVIEKTEAQINKLKDLKKAMMQELLTKGIGHTEFKDSPVGKIPKGWEVQRLGNVSDVFFSNVDKKSHPDEIPVFLCNYMDVYSNSYIRSGLLFMQATAKQREIDKFSLKQGDVIITKDSETPDDIAVASHVSEELDNVLCGYHLALIRTNKKQLDSGYLAHLFGLDEMQHYYYLLANGSTRFGLTTDAILDSRIPTPSLPEQQKIASTLSYIDSHLEKLNKKLQHTKSLKKALMQDLLTGKVRVKV
jgi:type I restriction enzyme, S subunit